MLRLTLRNAWDHRLRFLMTTFAVVIGVGFVVGSFVVTDSLRASVDQLFADITSGIDVSVRAETNLEAQRVRGPRTGAGVAGGHRAGRRRAWRPPRAPSAATPSSSTSTASR